MKDFESKKAVIMDEIGGIIISDTLNKYTKAFNINSGRVSDSAIDNKKYVNNESNRITSIKIDNKHKVDGIEGKYIAYFYFEDFLKLNQRQIMEIPSCIIDTQIKSNIYADVVFDMNCTNYKYKLFESDTKVADYIHMPRGTFPSKKKNGIVVEKNYIVMTCDYIKDKTIEQIKNIIDEYKDKYSNSKCDLNPEILINNEVNDEINNELKNKAIELLMNEKDIDEPMAELLVEGKSNEYLKKIILNLYGL